uniref:Uncharacterized protein n=1 Tax=Branchiostoma floridae TaxID=7739 RepID=C3YCD4_BRAFL|eukprot:XP_002605961.1 hypothetical protein BRAFLDRAFT_92211 [Branchiostoma floridae]
MYVSSADAYGTEMDKKTKWFRLCKKFMQATAAVVVVVIAVLLPYFAETTRVDRSKAASNRVGTYERGYLWDRPLRTKLAPPGLLDLRAHLVLLAVLERRGPWDQLDPWDRLTRKEFLAPLDLREKRGPWARMASQESLGLLDSQEKRGQWDRLDSWDRLDPWDLLVRLVSLGLQDIRDKRGPWDRPDPWDQLDPGDNVASLESLDVQDPRGAEGPWGLQDYRGPNLPDYLDVPKHTFWVSKKKQ